MRPAPLSISNCANSTLQPGQNEPTGVAAAVLAMKISRLLNAAASAPLFALSATGVIGMPSTSARSVPFGPAVVSRRFRSTRRWTHSSSGMTKRFTSAPSKAAPRLSFISAANINTCRVVCVMATLKLVPPCPAR